MIQNEQKPDSAEFRPIGEQAVSFSHWVRDEGDDFHKVLARVGQELRIAEARGAAESDTYQSRVADWKVACFGTEISADRVECNHRFLEEALELVQSTGCTQSEAHQLVDYVYGRPVGDPVQEVGGVMVTLAALCSAHAITLKGAAETELARVWTKVEKIRAKQAAKPKHAPLPEHVAEQRQKAAEGAETHEWKREAELFQQMVRNEMRDWRPANVAVLETRVRELEGEVEVYKAALRLQKNRISGITPTLKGFPEMEQPRRTSEDLLAEAAAIREGGEHG